MKKLLFSVFALLASVSLSAQDVTAIFNEGAAAYGAKDFAGAAAKFEQVIEQGIDNPDAASRVATTSARSSMTRRWPISRSRPSWPSSTAT